MFTFDLDKKFIESKIKERTWEELQNKGIRDVSDFKDIDKFSPETTKKLLHWIGIIVGLGGGLIIGSGVLMLIYELADALYKLK